MIRIIGKLFAVAAVFAALLHGSALHAAPFTWMSNTGTGNSCTAAQPCGNLFNALNATDAGGQVNCLDSPGFVGGAISLGQSVTIDCVGSFNFSGGVPQLTFPGTNLVKVRNVTFTGAGGGTPTAIKVTGTGTLILENCVFENFSGTALDIEPTGALTLVIKNSRISNNAAAGVIIKPAAGGSVTATFDGVTITNNAGGLKTDTTNGAVKVDIYNSTISNNANNGLVALGGAGGLNMMTVKNDVIASNGQAGIEASFGTAAVLVNNTVLDSNMTGATLTLSGGKILTYGNNSTIGNPGSGFTGTAPLN